MACPNPSRNGCDALELWALWPCSAQVGCIPVTQRLAQERFADSERELNGKEQ